MEDSVARRTVDAADIHLADMGEYQELAVGIVGRAAYCVAYDAAVG